MKINKFFFLFFGLFLGGSAFGRVVTAYFVPFEIETLIPITEHTIVCRAWEKWTLSDENILSITAIMVPDEKALFDAKRVRLRIVDGDIIFFADADGVVIKDGLSFKLDKEKFTQFASSVQVSQRQSRRPSRDSKSCPGA